MTNSTEINLAAEALKNGRLVAFPTETVYGLGADATSDTAVAKLFAAKGRPSFNPLISHVHAAEAAFALGGKKAGAGVLARTSYGGCAAVGALSGFLAGLSRTFQHRIARSQSSAGSGIAARR